MEQQIAPTPLLPPSEELLLKVNQVILEQELEE